MVWGIPLPPGPYGYFEGSEFGWSDRLKSHYETEMADEEKRNYASFSTYYHSVLSKFSAEWGVGSDVADDPEIRFLKRHEAPRWFAFRKGHKSPAAMISLPGRMLAVSEPLKGFIEWLDPSIHQFFPIDVRNTNGPVYDAKYFVMVVGSVLETFVPSGASNAILKPLYNDGTRFHFHGSKREVTSLSFDSSRFNGSHMWKELAFGDKLICISDELMSEIADSGLKMPHRWRMSTV